MAAPRSANARPSSGDLENSKKIGDLRGALGAVGITGREMKLIKSILLAGGAAMAFAASAYAADLPTKKGAVPAPAPNCFASFWSWLDSTPNDCPLSYWGVTFYATIDVGGGYETNAAKHNDYYDKYIQEVISKQSHGSAWQAVPSGLTQNNAGIKWKEQIVPSWYFIGDVNFGFNPYGLNFVDPPRSLEQNNTVPQYLQSANADSSRAYGVINTRAYAGVQNQTFGTLTYGRQYAFSNDNIGTYDPFGGAYAFSPIGNSSTLGGGLGDTELARYTNSIKYLYADHSIRAGVLSQVGGWSAGNNAQYAIEGDLGFDYAGFSFDAVYEWAKDAVALSTFGGSTAPYAASVLKATIENQNSLQAVGKYKWNQFTIYGGYLYEQDGTPTDLPATATIGTFNDGYQAVYGATGTGTQGNAFPIPKVVQAIYVGGKYAVLSNLDLVAGYYHFWQNDYRGSTATAVGSNSCLPNTSTSGPFLLKGTASSKCAGDEDAISGMIDYRPVKRVDVYGGVMATKVTGGLASGFIADNNIATTVGVRVGF
jgi:predicted porin